MSWFKSSVCVAAVAVVQGVFAGATYDAVSQPGDLIVTVDADSEVFDVSRLTDEVTNIVKRGLGEIVGVSIAGYEGDFLLEQGTWTITELNCFGCDTKGTIVIKDGGAMKFNSNLANTLCGKTVYLEGRGPDGKGVIRATKTTWNSVSNSSGKTCKFILTGDAYIDQQQRLDYYSCFDLNGHDLGTSGYTSSAVGGSYFTNSAARAVTMTVDHNEILVKQSDGNPFCGSTDNRLCLTNYAWYCLDWNIRNGWTIEFQEGSEIRSSKSRDSNMVTNTSALSGPIVISGDINVSNTRTNTVATICGPLSGSGSMNVGPGWLNFAPTVNTYVGSITATGAAGALPISRAGVRVFGNGPQIVRPMTFNDADLAVDVASVPDLPVITFTGDGAVTNAFTGGEAFGTRGTCAGIEKLGSGTLTLSASVDVTGRVNVAGGVLRLPTVAEQPYFGKPGLMGYGEAVLSWSPLSIYDEEKCVYWARHGMDHCIDNDLGPKVRFAHGYLWNRSDHNEKWSFKVSYNDRTWLKIDGKAVITAGAEYFDMSTRTGTVEVATGPHEFLIGFMASNTSRGGNPALRVDWQGRESTDNKDYVSFWESGDGFRMTVDETPPEDCVFWLPTLADVAFAPEATFDLSGRSFSVGNLIGSPTVAGAGTFTVSNSWTLATADFIKDKTAPTLTVAGKLVFADGTAFAFDDIMAMRHVRGAVICSASDGIDGLPTLPEDNEYGKWRLTKSADGKSLTLDYCSGLCVFIR